MPSDDAARPPARQARPVEQPPRDDVPVLGTVVGTVLDATGRPVSGASVAVVASAAQHPDIAALSAADGTFRLGRLPSGPAVLEARLGPAVARVCVDVDPQEPVSVQLELR